VDAHDAAGAKPSADASDKATAKAAAKALAGLFAEPFEGLFDVLIVERFTELSDEIDEIPVMPLADFLFLRVKTNKPFLPNLPNM
jgi:hypothetical protein